MNDDIQNSQHRFPYKNAFLSLLLVLLAANLALLVIGGDYSYDNYTGITVTVMLVCNHIAFQYKLPGVYGTIAKVLAWGLLCTGTLYIGTVVLRVQG
ncbi:hypothetical protein CA13_10730 [Planctomycetes bacterium CA13]|uniref:Uncharacterized protein n=1 Tax=Novipirellula herctigrandis TaxID=2527986 RepID=A0A5C5YYL5_9BACT|nr:hypothetical protein CA13_10730 [Planctomycetes bacterium CA13]